MCVCVCTPVYPLHSGRGPFITRRKLCERAALLNLNMSIIQSEPLQNPQNQRPTGF